MLMMNMILLRNRSWGRLCIPKHKQLLKSKVEMDLCTGRILSAVPMGTGKKNAGILKKRM